MAKSNLTESQRFWQKVICQSAKDCWFWSACCDGKGYGMFRLCSRQQVHAHAFAYREVIGPVPTGKELHHTCNNGHIGCVNPFHLEPLTRREHILISNGPCGLTIEKLIANMVTHYQVIILCQINVDVSAASAISSVELDIDSEKEFQFDHQH